ncbi:hypothetical protein ABBQ38_004288 [Trebouxia sp. C0009 RCD-2024]
MQRQSGSVLDAYIASQASARPTSGLTPWSSLHDSQAHVPLSADRPGGAGVSNDTLAFSSSAAANFGRDYSTLVRPHPQYHPVADARAASKPYTSSEATAFNPAAWQRDSRASTATQDPWAFAPRQTTFGYGSDSLNTWQQQQQYANAQQTAATEQHAQPQQQGWPPGSENLGHTEQHQLMHQLQHQQPQQQVQLQQQQQNPQIVRKPNSGDQLVQDLRAHWGSMASPPSQPQPPLTSTHPQPLAAPPSQSGFENMWGPTPAPPLGTRSALGLPPGQPGTTPASRLSEDAALLDFPDWDGPGGGAPSLDDMIMNSIGVAGAQAASDSLLPQLGQETSQQAAAADQPHHAKAASKKKQRGGKRSAAKGGKGARTTSGSMAHAADKALSSPWLFPRLSLVTDLCLRLLCQHSMPACSQLTLECMSCNGLLQGIFPRRGKCSKQTLQIHVSLAS